MSRLMSTLPLVAFIMMLGASEQLVYGQRGDIGFGGGGSFYRENTVNAPAGRAKVGFENGFSAGGWIGQNMYRYIGGEIVYLFEQNDLKLNAGSARPTFGGRSHAIHYDLLIHATPVGSKVRPFVSVGGGIKGYYGTGTETPSQPGQDYAILTKTSDWKGLLVVGGGIKFALSSRLNLKIEFQDYMTPFPTKVITPAQGAGIGGWVHDFVPMIGLGFTF